MQSADEFPIESKNIIIATGGVPRELPQAPFDGDKILNSKQILEMNDVDLVWIPRVNTIEGMTQEHIQKWNWRVTQKGWVNYPDYQARVFRNDENIRWVRPLHEFIDGCKTYAHLPPHEELSLYLSLIHI